MNPPKISVILPTRNPDRDRLAEVFAALARQTLPAENWDVCVVDNGSAVPLGAADLGDCPRARIVREECPGLLAARLAGLRESAGELLVFIDDDTVPAPGFLAAATAFMASRPRLGTAGGRIRPRYLAPPPPWLERMSWLLALRDNGPLPLEWSLAGDRSLPNWTPIGAGLVLRRAAGEAYLLHVQRNRERIERISWLGQGAGGVEDKDIVLCCLRAGWSTGYCPDMELEHIIPPGRLTLAYFEKLLPGIQQLWARTLLAHRLCDHPPIAPATLALRQAKAWLAFRAWRSPANRLDWLASCGFLRGLAAHRRDPVDYGPPLAADPSRQEAPP